MNTEMKRNALAVCLLAGGLQLAGCTQPVTREQTGAVLGAAAGGLLGAQVGSGAGQLAATAAGTLLGYAVGGSIGRTMDQVDRMKVAGTLENTPTGQTRGWRNPDSDARYEVTPTRTYQTASGPCREYSMDAWVGGERERVYGTACRQPDGSWKVES